MIAGKPVIVPSLATHPGYYFIAVRYFAVVKFFVLSRPQSPTEICHCMWEVRGSMENLGKRIVV
jgi:hypothetical protein